jgi:hypothetical protein
MRSARRVRSSLVFTGFDVVMHAAGRLEDPEKVARDDSVIAA